VALFDGLAVFPAIALDIPEAVAGEQARDRALEARGAFLKTPAHLVGHSASGEGRVVVVFREQAQVYEVLPVFYGRAAALPRGSGLGEVLPFQRPAEQAGYAEATSGILDKGGRLALLQAGKACHVGREPGVQEGFDGALVDAGGGRALAHGLGMPCLASSAKQALSAGESLASSKVCAQRAKRGWTVLSTCW
jgi:hypothetical protein